MNSYNVPAQNSKEEPDKLSKRGDLVSDQTANIEANAPLQSTGVAREEDRKGEKRKCEEDGGSQSGKRRSTTGKCKCVYSLCRCMCLI